VADILPTAVVGRRSGRVVRRTIVLVYLAILVLVPIVVITYRTFAAGFGTFVSSLTSDDALTAIGLTLEIAVISVLLNVVFGVGIALLVTRFRFPGRRLIGSLTDLSVSVSPIVVGLALVIVYGPYTGLLGKPLAEAGFQVVYALPGMVLATVFVSLPLVLREIVPVLEEVGTDQEQAARVLGASGLQVFRRITLPVIAPALFYGVVVSLARAIGEFGAVKVVSGNVSGSGQTQTATLLIETRIQNFEPGYYQLAFLLIVFTVAAIVIVGLIRSRSERRRGSAS
jgi:sulfate/thiosulfate transport system permease protein